MKKICLLFALSLVFSLASIAQLSIEAQRTMGGSSSDYFTCMQPTKDGGAVFAGYSISPISGEKTEHARGENDYWVVKLNKTGAIEWEKTIGGSGRDEATSIIQTKDRGFLIGGTSYSGVSGDKTTENFDTAGSTGDYWIVKLNAAGTIVWQKSYGGSYLDFFYSLSETKDGGFILSGTSYSKVSGNKTARNVGGTFYTDCWVIKTDSTGNIQWQKTYGGFEGEGSFNMIKQTKDGGYILGTNSASSISGNKTESNFGSDDYWVVKLDKKGNIVWQRTIGGNDWDLFWDIHQTNDGGYIIGGNSSSGISGNKTDDLIFSSVAGQRDYWIIKLDAAGNIEWQNDIGGTDDDEFRSIVETDDHGYIIAGNSNSGISGDKTENNHGIFNYVEDIWLVRLDVAGNVIWDKSIGGDGTEEIPQIYNIGNGTFLVGSASTSNRSGDKSQNSRGSYDYWGFQLSSSTAIVNAGNVKAMVKIGETNKIKLYPNPVKDKLTINSSKHIIVNLFDAAGKLVTTKAITSTGAIDMQKLPAGAYYITVNGSKEKYTVIKQ